MFEIRKIFTDKKIVQSLFLVPLITALLLAFVSGTENADSTESISYIYVLGNQGLDESTVETTDDMTISIKPMEYKNFNDFSASYSIGTDDATMVWNEDCIEVFYNSTSSVSSSLAKYCKSMIEYSYNEQIISLTNTDAMEVTETDYGANLVQNQMMAMMLPYMLVLLLFTNVSNYACDTIAGEKERGTFSKLLLAPIDSKSIILGKTISSTILGLISSIVYFLILAVISVICKRTLDIDVLGLDFSTNTSGKDIVYLFFYATLLCCMLSGIVVLCSLYSKNAKDAKNKLTPIMGVAIVVSLLSMFRAGSVDNVYYLIPLYNICITIQDILSQSGTTQTMLITAFSLALCSLVVFAATLISFKRENIRY